MKAHEDIDDRADDAFDAWRQRMLDAYIEGKEAGRLNLGADLCRYLSFEEEHGEWHRGRMDALSEQLQRRNAA